MKKIVALLLLIATVLSTLMFTSCKNTPNSIEEKLTQLEETQLMNVQNLDPEIQKEFTEGWQRFVWSKTREIHLDEKAEHLERVLGKEDVSIDFCYTYGNPVSLLGEATIVKCHNIFDAINFTKEYKKILANNVEKGFYDENEFTIVRKGKVVYYGNTPAVELMI